MTLNIPGSCGIYSPSPVQYSSFVVLLNVFVLLCRYLAHIDFCYIFQKEPELLSGNDVLWTFVNFAGEDHTNFQTLVAFLNMLSTLVFKCIICFVKHALLNYHSYSRTWFFLLYLFAGF